MPQKERPEGVDRSPVSISERYTHTHTPNTGSTPTAATPPTPNAGESADARRARELGLTEDQVALVHYLHRYGFVGAVGFVRQMPNAAIWSALVEVDYMSKEERAAIRSVGALIRHLVREACRE